MPYQPPELGAVTISTDKHKAMTLHIGLAALESVMLSEKPKSARYTRVSRGIDTILELVDIYLIEAWPADDICKAGDLVDEFNRRIDQVFGGRRV